MVRWGVVLGSYIEERGGVSDGGEGGRGGPYLEAAGEHFFRGGHLFWDVLFVRGVLVGASLVCGEKPQVSELRVDEVIEGLRVWRRGVEGVLVDRVRVTFRGRRLFNAPPFRILAPFFCPLPACLGHQTF